MMVSRVRGFGFAEGVGRRASGIAVLRGCGGPRMRWFVEGRVKDSKVKLEVGI